jgi:flagellar biosynthesis protein FlhG
MGQKVIAVDLDLGGSNLHTMLGIKNDLPGLGHYINSKDMNFADVVHPTELENLSFVPGDALYVGTANLPFFKKKKIITELIKLEADWVILDLGSGSATNIIDFFLISNCGVLLTTPEITSVLNLYSFLKNAFYRYLILSYKKKDGFKEKLLEAGKMRLEKDDLRFYEFVRLMKKDYPENADKIDQLISNFYPKLLLNMGNSERDISFGENLRSIIHKNLGLDIEYLGMLPDEPNARQSVIARKPISLSDPRSRWVENCTKIASRLLEFHQYPVTLYETDVDSLDVIYEDLKSFS